MKDKKQLIDSIVENLDKRDLQILAIARSEFAGNGYHSANMDSICREADIGKGTLYRRFHSKQILFFTILEWGFRSFMRVREREDADIPALEKVERYLVSNRKFLLDNLDLIRLFVHEQSRIMGDCSDDEAKRWSISYHRRLYAYWIELARQAREEGMLSIDEDPEVVGSVLGGMSHAIYSDLIAVTNCSDEKEFIKRERVFMRTLTDGVFRKGA